MKPLLEFSLQELKKVLISDQIIWLSKSAMFLITVDKMGKKE